MTYKIKICGLSSVEQIKMVVNSNADMAGFIFADPSPRKITPEDARELSFSTLAKNLDRVAVFVNPNNDFLEEAIDSINANFIQLHGNESVERCLEIKAITGLPIIKSIGVSNMIDIKEAEKYINAIDYFLFDAKPDTSSGGQRGGLNKVFDWSMLNNWKGPNYFLSGGLNISNVREAIQETNAYVIDVSSGVESKPGIKNDKMIKDFVKMTRSEFGNANE